MMISVSPFPTLSPFLFLSRSLSSLDRLSPFILSISESLSRARARALALSEPPCVCLSMGTREVREGRKKRERRWIEKGERKGRKEREDRDGDVKRMENQRVGETGGRG
jgi:hypothetical protein